MVATNVIIIDTLPKDVRPPITTYSPSMWADSFTSFSLDGKVQEKYAEAIEELKQEARSMLMSKGSTTTEKLILIDTLERLGVGFTLNKRLKISSKKSSDFSLKIMTMTCSLLQFNFACSGNIAIQCLAGNGGEFEETLTGDAKGLLSLYEAANVRIHGEDLLEDAVAFTTHHLIKTYGATIGAST
ncbi:UNVERIFIED_CONTAM: 5-epiaristolochene synthase [Sesamum latifolium]|uniref:5-epiaristolochene synthase n=1 Tax=Sesamum latifolium TaxID=2727402 RepID=A0AAW2XYX1_9LAMI